MTTTVEQAEQALVETEQQAEHWAAELAARQAELAQVREGAGADVLADPGLAEQVTRRIVELSAACDVAQSAANTAAGRVDPARRGVLRARAAELRARAGRLREAADHHWSITTGLLAQLREHEGADFVHFADSDPLARPVGYRPRAPHGGLYGDLRARVPVTLRMRGDADQLDQAAADLERWADTGKPAEVAPRVRRPMPEQTPAEREHIAA